MSETAFSFDWPSVALPAHFAAILESQRKAFTPATSIASYEGFGSFHSENVEVLMNQPEDTYKPPTVPLVARRVLSRSELQRIKANAEPPAGDSGERGCPSLEQSLKRLRIDSDMESTARFEEERPPLAVRADAGRGIHAYEPPLAYRQALEELLRHPMAPCPFGTVFRREHFVITDDVVFINHGGFGGALVGAMEAKHQLERRMESEVVQFVDRELLPLMVFSIRRLSHFLHADCKDLVLVHNATFGLNSAMKIIDKNDVVAYLDTEYLAVYKILWYRCNEVGATLHEIAVNKYFQDEDIMGNDESLTEVIMSQLPVGCTALVLDHITSTSALSLPVFTHLIPAARRRGVTKIVVDGAHAPLQVDLRFNDLPELSQPTAYVGNLHKWFCSPKAVGFLWAKKDAKNSISSAVLSHGAGEGFLSEFVWDGTKDYGAYVCIPALVDFWEAQELPRVRAYCSALSRSAAEMLTQAFASRRVPRGAAFMTLVELPELLQGPHLTAKHIQDQLHDQFAIEVPVKRVEDRFYIRISAFVYNTPGEYAYLREAVLAVAEQWVQLLAHADADAGAPAVTRNQLQDTGVPVNRAMQHNGCGLHIPNKKKKIKF